MPTDGDGGSDTTTPGTLTFPGKPADHYCFPFNGDTGVYERRMKLRYTVNLLSNPQNATIARATGNGTIPNDDTVPTAQSGFLPPTTWVKAVERRRLR